MLNQGKTVELGRQALLESSERNEPAGLDELSSPDNPFLSSLDPLETYGEAPRTISGLQRQIFGGRIPEWFHILDSLEGDSSQRFVKRAERMDNCSRYPMLLEKESGDLVLSNGRCKDRLCPVCASHRAKQTAELVERACFGADSLRFVTLTLNCDGLSLQAAYAKLISSWRALRKTRKWKSKIVGGVWTIEVTRNEETGNWHPHLHLLCDGQYFAQKELADLWHSITNDSFVVDIRMVLERKKASWYVGKYASKPPQISQWPASAICEYAAVTKGKRMIHTFGEFHNRKLEEREVEVRETIKDSIGSFAVLHRCCEANIEEAHDAARILGRIGPSWRRICEWCIDDQLCNDSEPTEAELRFALGVMRRLAGRDIDEERRKDQWQSKQPPPRPRRRRRIAEVMLPFKSVGQRRRPADPS